MPSAWIRLSRAVRAVWPATRTEPDADTVGCFGAAPARPRRARPAPSIPWLIGVARHRLADHWRRVEREQRGLRWLDGEPVRVDDPWETVVDRVRAREVLGRLGAHHRAALTLRYLDGLPVPEVARHLNRTLHATEALLGRARAAFRQLYEAEGGSRCRHLSRFCAGPSRLSTPTP